MSTIRRAVAGAVLSVMVASTPAFAQQSRHVASASALRQAVMTQAQTDKQTREAVSRVLKHDQVRATAARLGLNVVKAEAALATMSSTELAGLAETARQADAQLAGGQSTVVISTTTLLLIIIIVILLAN